MQQMHLGQALWVRLPGPACEQHGRMHLRMHTYGVGNLLTHGACVNDPQASTPMQQMRVGPAHVSAKIAGHMHLRMHTRAVRVLPIHGARGDDP